MPSKFTSPFATSFKTGVKNGTPCSTVVHNISKRTGKPVNTIMKSLCNAGLCFSQKFNGTWVYWPTFSVKTSTTNCNTMQTNMWQCFVEWCVASGWCTPSKLYYNATNQKAFMTFCKNFFNKQFTGVHKSTVKTSKTWKNWKKPSVSKNRWTTSYAKKSTKGKKTTTNTWGRTYKFPAIKSRSTTRRYVRAA